MPQKSRRPGQYDLPAADWLPSLGVGRSRAADWLPVSHYLAWMGKESVTAAEDEILKQQYMQTIAFIFEQVSTDFTPLDFFRIRAGK